MPNLLDFKPLESVRLPGLDQVEWEGLVLIVGPNSAGKTQLLQDIFRRMAGEVRKLVVAQEVVLRHPVSLDDLVDRLEEEGYVMRFRDDAGNLQVRPITTFLGTGTAMPAVPMSQLENLWAIYSNESNVRDIKSSFLEHVGRLLVTALFLDSRLTSVGPAGIIQFLSQPPQSDLHVLYSDDQAKKELLRETRSVFSKSVWPDISGGENLALRISDDPEQPTDEQRLSVREMAKFRTIITEGDGLKSYVAICVALLLGRRPVCLIDEPEMCLHPPQAYSLGRFVGRFGEPTDRVTFVATHSSHFLRGVIQSTSKLKILRLTRNSGQFSAHVVPAETLAQVLERPTVRAETVLDGIFSDAVIVLEADGDRTVYQATSETLVEEGPLDIHFTPVGGAGGLSETCRLYRALKIPVAVIADLDVLIDSTRLVQMVGSLTDYDTAQAIRVKAEGVAEALKAVPPTVSPEQLAEDFRQATELPTDWNSNDDAVILSAVRDIAHGLDRMRRIKSGGVRGLDKDLADQTSALIDELRNIGLFIVPVGELEWWLADYGLAASKNNKWVWANEAAAKVRSIGAQAGDIWDFMRDVRAYLAANLH